MFLYFLVPTVRFDPVTYRVTEGDTNVTLNISFVTSQPLLGDSVVRIYDIPTAGVTNHATGEYLNVIITVIYLSIAGVDYMSFNETITLPAGATRYDYTSLIFLNLEAELYREVFSATLEFVSGWPLTFTRSNATVTIYDANGNFFSYGHL